MKQLLTKLGVLAVLLVPAIGLTGQAAAVNIFTGFCSSSGSGSTTTVCKDANRGSTSAVDPVVTAIGVVIKILSYIIGIAAIIGVIVSGIRMMVSSGDPSSFAAARTALVYCLVGVAVAVMAQVIVRVVIGILS